MTHIEVTDAEGWRKQFTIEKNIVHIGSSIENDIVLSSIRGAGVLPLHAQMIRPAQASGCRLVNLSGGEIRMGASGEEKLAAFAAAVIYEGSAFRLGEFTLVFHDTYANVNPATSSRNIGVSLVRAVSYLPAEATVEGSLLVTNSGIRDAAQIELELQGLDSDCFEIEPGPLLFSHSEKEVIFRIHHRGSRPLAGPIPINVRATAPRAYPNEESTLSWILTVAPCFQFSLSRAGSKPAAVRAPAPTPVTPTQLGKSIEATQPVPVAAITAPASIPAAQVRSIPDTAPVLARPPAAPSAVPGNAAIAPKNGSSPKVQNAESPSENGHSDASRSTPNQSELNEFELGRTVPIRVEPLRPKAAPAVRHQPAEPDAAWWPEQPAEPAAPKILKIKASPRTSQAASAPAPVPTNKEDWWSVDDGSSNPKGGPQPGKADTGPETDSER